MGIRRAMIALIVVAVTSATAERAFAGKIVSWVDENGVTHFTDAGLANGQTNAVSLANAEDPDRSVPTTVTPEQHTAAAAGSASASRSEGKKSGLRGYRSSWARDPDRYKNLK